MSLFAVCMVLGFVVSVQAALIAVLLKAFADLKRRSNSRNKRNNKISKSLKNRISVLEEEVKELKKGVEELGIEHNRNIKKTKELQRCYKRTSDVISGLIDSGLLIKSVKYNTSFDEVYDDLKEVVEFYSVNNITPEEVVGLFGKLNPLEDLTEIE